MRWWVMTQVDGVAVGEDAAVGGDDTAVGEDAAGHWW